ncbi:hypothetical protein UVI_02058150 [Ustilaginoidea virens]|uniref:Cytochrome P450 alkane hydroxylase n=1 Tax=Ustilaginoidea virens TaxID=1159556 RepID=A0A1B5L585_USTVR|nr:hypothetical protein UVI_02058150 [Ustilaginoidea virens]
MALPIPNWSISAGLGALGVVVSIFALIWTRHRAVDDRIRLTGGARAPVLARNLISATRLYVGIAKHQYNNRLVDWCIETLDRTGHHYAEFSLTGSKRVILTREPEQIRSILATNFKNFGHGPQWHRLWRPFLGNGIFATDGQRWHRSRSIIRPMFVKARLRNMAIFDNCTNKLLSVLPPSGTTVNMKDYFYRWALDTTTEFLLGENVNSLSSPDHEVAEAMAVAQRIQMYIFVLKYVVTPSRIRASRHHDGFARVAPLIPKGDYYRAIRRIEEFIEPVIQRTIASPPPPPQQQVKESSCQAGAQCSLLHSIAQVSRDPKVIRDEIMSVLLAGRDTTAATLSWAMYELSHAPGPWARLRSEVLRELGPRGMPTYETLKNMKHVKNILNETLRLHPAIPINMRQALEDTTIPGAPGQPDVVLLKGDTVTINTMGMHARKDLYPQVSRTFADPAVFTPDRWDHWSPAPWTYLPFHGGPRTCLGQNFALTEMAFCLARLAQRFERLEYRGDWHAQTLRADIIGTPALDVPIAFFEA